MGAKEKNGSATTVSTTDDGEVLPERGHWGSPAEFILSCLGYAVGLGNVWRFPYLCFENGGGAFLIPYFLMLTFVGIPVFMIELTVGQYSGSGPATVFEAAPLFKGVGFGMLVISFISSIYYNLVIAWSIYYLAASFQKVLPWQECTHDFNTPQCFSVKEAEGCVNGTWFNQTCFLDTVVAAEDMPVQCNISLPITEPNNTCIDNPLREWLNNQTGTRVSSSQEYFNQGMLSLSGSIEDSGHLSWELTLCLLLAWIICYLCIIKGITSSGKVVYFTATFPYLLLFILLVRAVLLEGAWEGIKFYLTPQWHLLAKPKVWADAAGQIFFSLSVGGGGLMTFASYNKFSNNIYRDTLIVSIGNCLTSFFAGFAIFSIIGYMSVVLERPIDSASGSGSGLAFVAYPEVMTLLPVPQLWAFLFFFMLLTLGLDSQFASLENIQTAITDTWPQLRRYKWAVAGILCFSMFVLGLTQCTQAGLYWTDLMSYYSSGWALVLMGAIEGMVFPWVYGSDRLLDDIEAMVGFRLWKHWWFTWTILTPLLLIIMAWRRPGDKPLSEAMMVILIVNFIDFTPLSVGDYVLEDWAQALGWCMALMTVVGIPVFAAIEIWKSYRDPDFEGLTFFERLRKLCQPSDKWIPANEKDGAMAAPSKPSALSHQNPAFQSSADNLEAVERI